MIGMLLDQSDSWSTPHQFVIVELLLRECLCFKASSDTAKLFQLGSNRNARAVRGGAKRVLWVEQFWNVHPRKLDRERNLCRLPFHKNWIP